MSADGAAPACGVCGRTGLPADARFCPRCGGRLALGTPPAAGGLVAERPDVYTPEHLRREVLTTRSALEGERKHVAVLMADVVDSLATADALDPEQVHELMGGFFELALEAVHRHGGTINQFRGDGFMALFGAPRTRGGEALRAVRAALELGGASRAYGETVLRRYGVPLLLRMGVHAGLVWVGAIGSERRRDYTAEGATVGVAARLERLAEPGQVLVSESVARAVGGEVGTRDLGTRRLKGVREPVRVFELVDAPPEGAPPEREEEGGRPPPLRGRGRELRRMERQRAAVGEGGACLVELRGASGVGKSRLLQELVARAEAAGERVPRAACAEEDAFRAFTAWLDMLERPEGWGPLAGRAGLLAKEIRAGRAGAPDAVAAAARELLEADPAPGPRTLLFEDVQWMDPSSWGLVGGLLARPPAPGLVVLVSCRDEAPTLWEVPVQMRVALGPLEPADTRALVAGLLAEEPSLVELVVERSGGNPLFALELARSLRDGPSELRSAARAEARLLASPVRVPESVHGILAARIDSLPDDAKRLLQAAAVVGGSFDALLLRRIGVAEEAEPEPLLADLVASGFLAPSVRGLDFAHVLCREVAYGQMLLSRRRLLHGRLAELLEPEAAGDDPYAASVVGHHWARAERGGRAARFLARAGRIYLQRLAVGEAASHLRRAWEILGDPARAERADEPLRVQVGLHLAEALNDRDLSGEASAVLASLPDLVVGETDPLPVAQALVNQGWVAFTEQERIREGRALLERGLELAERCPGGTRVVGSACAFLIRVHHLEGQIDRAVAHARRVAEIASAAGNRFALVFGRGNEGFVVCERGEVARGRALCEEAVALSEEAEDRAARALAQAWLARACVYAGDPERALRVAREAAKAGDEAGQVGALYTARTAAGEACLLLGEARRGAAFFDEAAALNDRWTSTRVFLATGLVERGRFDEAAAMAEACLARELPMMHRMRLLRVLGLARGLGGPGGRAADAPSDDLVREALSLADGAGLPPHVASCLAALAELAASRGDGEAATWYLARATGIWEGCGMHAHAEAARAAVATR